LQCIFIQILPLNFKISKTQSCRLDDYLRILFQSPLLSFPLTLPNIVLNSKGSGCFSWNFCILIQTACIWNWFWMTFQRFSPKKMAPNFFPNIQLFNWVLFI
jgi:hypothetical protein